MKNLLYLFAFLLLISCQEKDATPNVPVDDTFDPATATLIKQGMLISVVHTVSGTATIYDSNGKKILLLDPFSTDNGPDLKVYLSKTESASSYIKLDKLKSTVGKQSYTIPDGTNLSEYNYVHIWCEQFSVDFGHAELK